MTRNRIEFNCMEVDEKSYVKSIVEKCGMHLKKTGFSWFMYHNSQRSFYVEILEVTDVYQMDL